MHLIPITIPGAYGNEHMVINRNHTIKKLVLYVDVKLLFVSKISTFDSLNPQYFEIFGFNLIDFVCFSNVVFLEIYSIFPKEKRVFFFQIIHLDKLLFYY